MQLSEQQMADLEQATTDQEEIAAIRAKSLLEMPLFRNVFGQPHRLTRIWRQESIAFQELLRRTRMGDRSTSQVWKDRERAIPKGTVVTELVALRRQRDGFDTSSADSFNTIRLNALPGQAMSFKMRNPVGDQQLLDKATQSSEEVALKVSDE